MVLFSMQNTTRGSYLAALHKVVIPVMENYRVSAQ
jgi:hypothetical protein